MSNFIKILIDHKIATDLKNQENRKKLGQLKLVMENWEKSEENIKATEILNFIHNSLNCFYFK